MLVANPMKRISSLAIVLLLATPLAFGGCARQPSQKKSASIIQHFFNKYGKKYPNTIYGKGRVKEVQITNQQEIHRGLVAVESFVTLGDGNVERVHATLENGPLGWHFVSWENDVGK